MKSTSKYKFVEWLSAREMHEASKQWLSELMFIKDEHEFLDKLIGTYTLQLVDSKIFGQSKAAIDALQRSEKDRLALIQKVSLHINQLDIMTDKIDQLQMEKAYIATHKELLDNVTRYFKEYRLVKVKLFGIITSILKKEKQKRLLG